MRHRYSIFELAVLQSNYTRLRFRHSISLIFSKILCRDPKRLCFDLQHSMTFLTNRIGWKSSHDDPNIQILHFWRAVSMGI
jgi:hypothetical protein